jgi:hypothetical protein
LAAVHEHDQAPGKSDSREERQARRAPEAPVPKLQQAVGNRALGRMLQRMQTAEAVDSLEKSLKPGVLGAEQQVANTLTSFSHDAIGLDKVAVDFEKKTKEPLARKIDGVGRRPPGFFPGISGEKAGGS